MDGLKVRVFLNFTVSVFLLIFCTSHVSNAYNEEYSVDTGGSSPFRVDFALLDQPRHRRDVSSPPTAVTSVSAAPSAVPPAVTTTTTDTNNATTTLASLTAAVTNGNDSAVTVPTVSVTQTPLLGVNGSGQLHVTPTSKQPKVSEPIVPDDNFNEIFKEPEIIKAEHNLTNLAYDSHSFYNSTFIGNVSYFEEHWANITKKKADPHPILSDSHRRATSVELSFDFPFYGHMIRNITVATGGFIYTGEHVHNWLAATQYIAPLMANFDTKLNNDSYIRLQDDGDQFTAFWENVALQEDATKKFTFAVTLYKSGDIIFAYKTIPIDVQVINDIAHPVKVGISDAYLTDKIVFYVRRKTIYEYHRVSFKDHMISNNTILRILALPTCLQYESCDDCLNHNTGFNCTWCPQIQKCSSGTDRNKQDWMLRRCERTAIVEAGACAAAQGAAGTEYITDQRPPVQETVLNTTLADEHESPPVVRHMGGREPEMAAAVGAPRSAVGGAVGAFLAVALVCCAGAWLLYAFKNPHTRSGQALIKYRPSQWNWRRGEARYTAATIHM